MTIYLDNAATTRTSSRALAAMDAVYAGDAFANPASSHAAGDAALRALEGARRQVAQALGAHPSEVIFTAGGSEANNQALLTGAAYGAQTGRRHIVASAIEHPSVNAVLLWLSSPDGPYGGNFEVTYVRPQTNGVLEVADVREAVREDTCLISVMTVNNEIGSVQPIHDICRVAHKRDILFHTDAVQAAGHIPVDFTEDEIDLLSISGHKFHGPRGIGALLCTHRIKPAVFIKGGSQERGHRAGTVNVAGAVGMAAALTDAVEHLAENRTTVEALRTRLVAGLSTIEGVRILTPEAPELHTPGTVGITVAGINREAALVLLDERGLCVSGGSACAAGALEMSGTLGAMGIDPEEGRGFLRFSIDAQENSAEQIDEALVILKEVVDLLRKGAHE